MKKYIIATLLISSFSFVFAQSVGSTVDDSTPMEESSYYCPKLTPSTTSLYPSLYKGLNDKKTEGRVSELQKFLADYFDVKISGGTFGSVTKSYVISFQEKNNLPSVGTVGKATREKIASVCSSSNEESVAESNTTNNTQVVDEKGCVVGVSAWDGSKCRATGLIQPTEGNNIISNPVAVVTDGPLIRLEYDSSSKEIALKATASIKVTAGNSDFVILKPVPGSVTQSSYAYFTMNAINTEGVYGKQMENLIIDTQGTYSGEISEFSNYWVVKAGRTAQFNIRQAFNLKHMFAGSYHAVPQLYTFNVVNNVGYSNSILSSKDGNSVTIIGETSPYISKVEVFSGVTGQDGSVSIIGARFDATSNTVDISGKTLVGLPSLNNGTLIKFFLKDYNILPGNYVTQITTKEGQSNQFGLNVEQPIASSCKILDVYAKSVPGYTYSNLYIKTNIKISNVVTSDLPIGITGTGSWDNLTFKGDNVTGDLIANQTMNSTGVSYVIGKKNNIKLVQNGSTICESMSPAVSASPTAVVTSGPSVALNYDSSNKEVSLSAKATVKVTAGDSNLWIKKPGTNESSEVTNPSYFQMYVLSGDNGLGKGGIAFGNPDTLSNLDNYMYWVVEAGKSRNFSISSNITNVNQMFAGSYHAAPTFYTPIAGAYDNVLSSKDGNYVTIIGETSPYISNVVNENGNIVITGARLNLSDNYLQIDGTGNSRVSKLNPTNSSVTISKSSALISGLSTGSHYLKITNSKTGNSNDYSFYVKQTVSQQPTIKSIVLDRAAGIFTITGSGFDSESNTVKLAGNVFSNLPSTENGTKIVVKSGLAFTLIGKYYTQITSPNGATDVFESDASQITPTVTISASKTLVEYGGQTTITWSSTGVAGCKWAEGDNQFKNYENKTSGTNRYTQSLYASQKYTIDCVGANGVIASNSVEISVASSPVETLYNCNGVVSHEPCTQPTPTVLKPTVNVSSGGGSLVLGSENKVGEFTVSADASGKIGLVSASISFSTAGITGFGLSSPRIADGNTTITGMNASVSASAFYSGKRILITTDYPYEISAGTSKTFSVFATVTGTPMSGITPKTSSYLTSPVTFKWKDIVGGNIEYDGTKINNFPNNSFAVSSAEIAPVPTLTVDGKSIINDVDPDSLVTVSWNVVSSNGVSSDKAKAFININGCDNASLNHSGEWFPWLMNSGNETKSSLNGTVQFVNNTYYGCTFLYTYLVTDSKNISASTSIIINYKHAPAPTTNTMVGSTVSVVSAVAPTTTTSQVPTTTSCKIVDVYAKQVTGRVYSNLYIKTSNLVATSGLPIGIKGTVSWDSLKFTVDSATGDLIASQTIAPRGVSYILGMKNNIKLVQNGEVICQSISSPVSTIKSTSPKVLGDSTMCVEIPRNLHRGAESSSVNTLQKFLQSKGFLTEVTGFYGDKTVEAVKDYQASAGLPVTGMVYEFTRQTMRDETCQ